MARLDPLKTQMLREAVDAQAMTQTQAWQIEALETSAEMSNLPETPMPSHLWLAIKALELLQTPTPTAH
jgi:hypothetical protein